MPCLHQMVFVVGMTGKCTPGGTTVLVPCRLSGSLMGCCGRAGVTCPAVGSRLAVLSWAGRPREWKNYTKFK